MAGLVRWRVGPARAQRTVLALLILAGCGARVEVLKLDDDGAQTLILAVLRGTDISVSAFDLATFGRVEEEASTEETTVYALFFDAPPSEQPFPLGDIQPGSARRLPEPQRTLRSIGGQPWAAADVVPRELDAFRFDVPCPPIPPAGMPRRGTISKVPGCPVPWPPRPAELCYGLATPVADLPTGDNSDAISVDEGGQRWLYFQSTHAAPMPGSTQLFRVALSSPSQAQAGSLERVSINPEGPTVKGAVSAPWIRADGHELFVASSYPDGSAIDPEIAVASRGSLGAPWSKSMTIDAIGVPILGSDGVYSPVLMADDQTLLYVRSSGEVYSSFRTSTEPGDRSFLPVAAVDAGGKLENVSGLGLSCDGANLIYVDGSSHVPLMASIRDLPVAAGEAFRVGPPSRLAVTLSPPDLLRATEAPDCSALYLSTAAQIWVATRAPCPL